MNSAEDHEAADSLPTHTTHHFEEAPDAAAEPVTPPNAIAESSTSMQANSGANLQQRGSLRGALLPGLRTGGDALSGRAEETVAGGVNCLQWIEVLEVQVVGACRSDERLRPLLRWNVSCFGSDGRLLAHLGQHFKARELALLARCLCTPVVSQSWQGFSPRPVSVPNFRTMQLVFADDVGTLERVAVTIPGLESGGLLIEELKEDASRRTFVLKDCSGKITNYFWQSENIKSNGDELIAKIRTMLKRRPTLAHLTGIDEGRLDSFVDYLRTAIFSKTSSTLAPPTQIHNFPPKPKLLEFPSKDLLKHTSIKSSMEKVRQCMQEMDSSLCPSSPLHMLARTLPATIQLIESLKRLRQCLHCLTTRRSNIMRDNVSPHARKGPPFVSLCQPVTSLNASYKSTVIYGNFEQLLLDHSLGPTSLDCNIGSTLMDQNLLNYPSRQFCPLATKHFRLHKPLVYNYRSFLGDFFTHEVSQMLAIILHMPNGAVHTHNLYMLLFALEHCGDNSIPHLSAFMDHLRSANLGGHYGTNVWRSLPMHMNHVENGVILHDPSARSGLRRLIEDDQVFQNDKRKIEECSPSCRRCTAGTGLGNLVLINFFVQETWPGLRLVMAEITSGNISYIVVSVAHCCSTSLSILKLLTMVHIHYINEESVGLSL